MANYGDNRQHGLVRAAVVCGDGYTASIEELARTMTLAEADGVEVLVLPSTAITLSELDAAVGDELLWLVRASRDFYGLLVAAAMIRLDGVELRCGVTIERGSIVGVVPELGGRYCELPTKRKRVRIGGKAVPFGVDLQFKSPALRGAVIAIEVADDARGPITPGTFSAIHGANVIVNLPGWAADSGEAAMSRANARQLSAQLICCYVHAAAGGAAGFYENGSLVEEEQSSHQGRILVADLDYQKVNLERLHMGSFADSRSYLPWNKSIDQRYRTVRANFGSLEDGGNIRFGAAVPEVGIADPEFNAAQTARIMSQAEKQKVDVLVFPELNMEGYTASDLLQQQQLIDATLSGLEAVRAATFDFRGLVSVGAALLVSDALYNCAVIICRGRYLAVVPKSYIPNYREFYEKRQIAPAHSAFVREIELNGFSVPFGTKTLVQSAVFDELVVASDLCEDLWVPIPPSTYHALAGATVIINLSASNELVDKDVYRRGLVSWHSGRLKTAYIYTSSGWTECTTDMVMSGQALIGVSGRIVAEAAPLQKDAQLIVYEMPQAELHRLRASRESILLDARERLRQMPRRYRIIVFHTRSRANTNLYRTVNPYPFVPQDSARRDERCAKIFRIQLLGLVRRLKQLGPNQPVTIGVSGGLDSAHALAVTVKAFDELEMPRTNIIAQTLRGFGTHQSTYNNALALMRSLGVTIKDIDIRPLAFQSMKTRGHKPFGIDISDMNIDQFLVALESLPPGSQDVDFENEQARCRTEILMNTGFVIGTGDLSEIAEGWSTYNADQMSMYNVNGSLPKTLIQYLVRWEAASLFHGCEGVFIAVVETAISPELLPGKDDSISQKTEDVIGPYVLIDFYIYNVVRNSFSCEKALYLAQFARFKEGYELETKERTLETFIIRFFGQQYKRDDSPGSPKVGMSLSQRSDWRGVDGARPNAWLKWKVTAAAAVAA